MKVKHISTSIEIAATGRIYKTRRIIGFSPGCDLRGLELSPCLIERDPHGYTRIRVQTVHDLLPFLAILRFTLRSTVFFNAVEIPTILPLGICIAARHILPYDDTIAIAVCVPGSRFDLYVLTDHVKAPILCFVNIVDQCFMRWSCIEAVRPPALIERAELEQILVVELQAHYTAVVTTCRELSHCGIASDFIYRLAILIERDIEIIKVRRRRRPERYIGRHLNLNGISVDAATRSDSLAVFLNYDLSHHTVSGSSIVKHIDSKCIGVDIRQCAQSGNMCGRYRLHPYGLPYTCYRSIPDAMRFGHLLATWLSTTVGRIPYPYTEFILPLTVQSLGYIHTERGETACMTAYFNTIDPDVALPVYSSEIEQYIVILPVGRHGKRTVIPQFLAIAYSFANTRQTRFDSKRHQDLSIVLPRSSSSFRSYGVVPQSIEVLPTRTLHNRTRIFRMHIIHIDGFRP